MYYQIRGMNNLLRYDTARIQNSEVWLGTLCCIPLGPGTTAVRIATPPQELPGKLSSLPQLTLSALPTAFQLSLAKSSEHLGDGVEEDNYPQKGCNPDVETLSDIFASSANQCIALGALLHVARFESGRQTLLPMEWDGVFSDEVAGTVYG